MTLFATTDRTPSLKDIPAKPETLESQFQQNEIERRALERQIADAHFSVNRWVETHKRLRPRTHWMNGELYAMAQAAERKPPEQKQLELLQSQVNALQRQYNDNLAQHAALKLKLGLTK